LVLVGTGVDVVLRSVAVLDRERLPHAQPEDVRNVHAAVLVQRHGRRLGKAGHLLVRPVGRPYERVREGAARTDDAAFRPDLRLVLAVGLRSGDGDQLRRGRRAGPLDRDLDRGGGLRGVVLRAAAAGRLGARALLVAV